MLATTSAGVSEIAKTTGLSRQTVYRISAAPAEAEVLLTTWETRHVQTPTPVLGTVTVANLPKSNGNPAPS
jgi:hypothetical protein